MVLMGGRSCSRLEVWWGQHLENHMELPLAVIHIHDRTDKLRNDRILGGLWLSALQFQGIALLYVPSVGLREAS